MPSEIERPKFLIDLLAEVDAFEAVYECHDPVEESETPRGTLSPWLIRAYSLARYYAKQARLLAVERDYDDLDDFARDPELTEMKTKAELLLEIMWRSARAEFGLWTEPNIGVRKDFTIIRSAGTQDDDGFRKFLMRMLGK